RREQLAEVALLQLLQLRQRERQLSAAVALQERFVVERVHVGRTAGHEQKDDPLGAGPKVRQLRRQRSVDGLAGRRARRFSRQPCQSKLSKTASRCFDQAATRNNGLRSEHNSNSAQGAMPTPSRGHGTQKLCSVFSANSVADLRPSIQKQEFVAGH